jgi:hypothetical protein
MAISSIVIKVELSITFGNQDFQHWENIPSFLPKEMVQHGYSLYIMFKSDFFLEVLDFHVLFNIVQCSSLQERSIL